MLLFQMTKYFLKIAIWNKMLQILFFKKHNKQTQEKKIISSISKMSSSISTMCPGVHQREQLPPPEEDQKGFQEGERIWAGPVGFREVKEQARRKHVRWWGGGTKASEEKTSQEKWGKRPHHSSWQLLASFRAGAPAAAGGIQLLRVGGELRGVEEGI